MSEEKKLEQNMESVENLQEEHIDAKEKSKAEALSLSDHIKDTSGFSDEDWENYEHDREVRNKKRSLKGIGKFVVLLALMWCVVYCITHFLYGFIIVDGSSMTNTLHDQQVGIIQKWSIHEKVQRGDIIVFFSDELDEYLIKRMIALPGDTIKIESGVVTVNGEVIDEPYIKEPMDDYDSDTPEVAEMTIADDEFFAMGDNRNGSYDCRELGPAPMEKLEGILRINLGAAGITKKRAIIGFVALFIILMIIGFIQDVMIAKKLEEIPEEFKNFPIDMDISTCTGEKTIGFRNPATHKLELMELVSSEADIKAYCDKYGYDYKEFVK